MSELQHIHSVLDNYFPYCKSLDSYAKDTFCSRVSHFIKRKEFVAKGELQEVTEEMRIIVGAHYAWLTRGFARITLDLFPRIILYPDSFYSGYTQDIQDGEAHPSGAVVFGWKELAFGCLKPDDAYNPGFRVFANALAIQNMNGSAEESNFFSMQKLEQFSKIADKYYAQMEEGNAPALLMDSKAEYRPQMFGCCMEILMEQPQELEKQCPDLSTNLKSLFYLTTY